MTRRSSSDICPWMSLMLHFLYLTLVSHAVLAQDNYGNPGSPLLQPSSQLRFSPNNFQSLLGGSQFSSGGSQFSSGGSQFSSGGSSSNDIFIEDFSPIQSPFDQTLDPDVISGPITSSTFSQASFPQAAPRGSSSFPEAPAIFAKPIGTPPTTTTVRSVFPQRLGSEPQFARQTASNIPPLSRPSTGASAIPGGVDFTKAQRTPDGRLCVIKEESIETVSKDPVLSCIHKNLEKCHYTYITYFNSAQEEVCEENFEKKCQITFRQEASKETVRKCYRPQEKICNGQGDEECRTVYESSCTTRYIEKTPGKFVGDTACEKLPVKICGKGCVNRAGAEECHEKQIDSLIDVPEEVCDLNPQKTCRLQTKLVPSLKPKQECTIVPQETCTLNFSQPKRNKKPLRTEWCLDEESTGTSAQLPQSQYGRNQ